MIAMRTRGITLIELMIAMALLIVATTGISVMYLAGQRLVEGGLRQVDIQRDAQMAGERITRWIRPATSVSVLDSGDRLEMVVPLSIDEDDVVTRSIYYDDEKIYYDSDINDNNPVVEVASGVFRTRNDIFELDNNIVDIEFGIEIEEYLRALTQPMELSLRVKTRNVE